jgi:hypothetical protein
MKKLLPLLLLLCCACVDLPTGGEGAPEASLAPVASPFKGLDPGYKSEETAHFALDAYSSSGAALYASLCEENYSRIMQDLGLYSFVPARPYNVVVYRDAAEYHAKTGQPDWSGGATYGNALLLFEGEGVKATLGHEMTHLIFNEFMGLAQAAQLRWLNEGVAVYEETRANQASSAYYTARLADSLSDNPIPFSQMINLAPQDDAHRGVDRWYAQVGSVAGFMIRQGGSFNFSLFLGRLRDGGAMDKAIEATYPGMWTKLADVEKGWLLEVRKQ